MINHGYEADVGERFLSIFTLCRKSFLMFAFREPPTKQLYTGGFIFRAKKKDTPIKVVNTVLNIAVPRFEKTHCP